MVTDQIGALEGIITTETHIAFRTYRPEDLGRRLLAGLLTHDLPARPGPSPPRTKRACAALARGRRRRRDRRRVGPVHVALYPWGLIEDRLDEASHLGVSHLSPVQRGLIVGDVEAAGTPIILIHGVVDNRSIFTLLRRALRGRGFGRHVRPELLPVHRRHRRGGRAARHADRGGLRADRLRARAHHRALDGRARCPLLRAAARRRPSRSHGVHPGHSALRHHPGALVPWPVIRQMRSDERHHRRARRAGSRLPHPVHRDLVRPRPARPPAAQRPHRSTPTCGPATSSSRASGTCRCPSIGAWCTRSRQRWPSSTTTARRSRPA